MSVLLIAFGEETSAEMTPDRAAKIGALIERLGDRRYAVREKATEDLTAMGADVVFFLRKTLAETDDPEIIMRGERVLQNVKLFEKRIRSLGPAPGTLPDGAMVSSDGTRLAYVLQHDRQWVVVCDGKEGPPCDRLPRPVFSPDGKHLAYAAARRGQSFLVLDGEEGRACEEVGFVTFSPDGSHLAYAGRQDGRWFVFRDGEVGPPYDEVKYPRFSGDSRRFAFCGRRDREWHVVCNGKESPGYSAVGYPVFSPDSKRMAFFVHGPEVFAVCDGKAGRGVYDALRWLTFSPDSAHLVYLGRREGRWFFVRDGREQPDHEAANPPFFSPRGSLLVWRVSQGGREFYVCNGKKQPEFDAVTMPVFTPDDAHFAYVARKGDKWTIVRDGETWGTAYDQINELLLSPDGELLAHSARRGRDYFSVCNGREGKRYDGIGSPFFSPDSRHLVTVREDLGLIACDGIESPRHAWIRFFFLRRHNELTGKLRYVTCDGQEAWLVEVDWPEGLDWTNGLGPAEPAEAQP
jgi:hypothetical protein